MAAKKAVEYFVYWANSDASIALRVLVLASDAVEAIQKANVKAAGKVDGLPMLSVKRGEEIGVFCPSGRFES